MKRFLCRAFLPAVLLVLCAAAAILIPTLRAQAAEKLSLETANLTLSISTGCPSGDVSVRTILFRNAPSDFDERYSVRWYSGEESVVTVTQDGTVHAVQAGTASVYCEVTRICTGKRCATLAVSVKVQEGGGGVVITGAPNQNSMRVGDTFDFNRKISGDGGADVTDRTVWECSDPAVASVDQNGVVTALSGGTFTLWAKTVNASGMLTAVSPGVTITVTTGIRSAVQTGPNEVELSFAVDLPDDLSVTDFSLREADGTLLGIESANVSEDGKKVTLTTYTALEEGKTYFVSAGDFGTVSFKATMGAAGELLILTQRIRAGEPTRLEYALYDDDGKESYRGTDVEDILREGDRIELISSDEDAYIDDLYLTLYGVDTTAVVSLRYYPTGGGTYLESRPTRITAVEDPTLISSVSAYTVSDLTDGSAAVWSPAQPFIRMGEEGRYLHLQALDAQGQTVYSDAEDADGWHFVSLNTGVLQVDGGTGALTPISVGTAVIICSHNDFTFSASVAVKQEALAQNMIIDTDKTTLNVPSGGSDSTIITVTVYDASGEPMAVLEDAVAVRVTSDSGDAPAITAAASDGKVRFTVTADESTGAGQHKFEFTCGDAAASVTVTVVPPVSAETTSVTGSVIWYDDGAARPSSVTLTLFADGETAGTAQANQTDNWCCTWTELPVYREGSTTDPIEYTVTASAPAGYSAAAVSGTETALYTAQLTDASAERDVDGSVLITVRFEGVLGTANAAWFTVTDGTTVATVYRAETVSSAVVLNMGDLPEGTYTITYSAAYGDAAAVVEAAPEEPVGGDTGENTEEEP